MRVKLARQSIFLLFILKEVLRRTKEIGLVLCDSSVLLLSLVVSGNAIVDICEIVLGHMRKECKDVWKPADCPCHMETSEASAQRMNLQQISIISYHSWRWTMGQHFRICLKIKWRMQLLVENAANRCCFGSCRLHILHLGICPSLMFVCTYTPSNSCRICL